MSDILKITKETIATILSLIKKEITDKDKYIIASALQGKDIISYSGTIASSNKKVGNIFYNTSNKKYYYYNGSSLAEITVDLLLDAANNNKKFPTRQWWEVASTIWQTSTPFYDIEGMVSAIYKGETVGDYTKWLLIMRQDSDDQTYSAYKTGTSSYIYGTKAVSSAGYNSPWEIWLPSSLEAKSVSIDW